MSQFNEHIHEIANKFQIATLNLKQLELMDTTNNRDTGDKVKNNMKRIGELIHLIRMERYNDDQSGIGALKMESKKTVQELCKPF